MSNRRRDHWREEKMRPLQLGPAMEVRFFWCRQRRRRRGQQKRQRLPRQCLRIDQRNQDQPDKYRPVEKKRSGHPAAAARVDSARGFKGGIFKHGLPPTYASLRAYSLRPDPKLSSRTNRETQAHETSFARRACWRGRMSSRPSVHPHRNHCVCVDTTLKEIVPGLSNRRTSSVVPPTSARQPMCK